MSYNKVFVDLCNDYVLNTTSDRYRLLCERQKIEKLVTPLINTIEKLEEALSKDYQVQWGGFTIPYFSKEFNSEATLIIPTEFWDRISSFSLEDRLSASFDVIGVLPNGYEFRTSITVEEIMDGLRDSLLQLTIFEKAMSTTISGSSALGGYVAVEGFCTDILNQASSRVKSFMNSVRNQFIEYGNSIEQLIPGLWSIAGGNFLSAAARGDTDDALISSAFVTDTLGYTGASPLSMVYDKALSIGLSFRLNLPEIVAGAIGYVGILAGTSFYLFQKAVMGAISGTIKVFQAIDNFFTAENIVLSDCNPDDLSIDFGGCQFSLPANTNKFDQLTPQYGQKIALLKEMLDNLAPNQRAICAVVPGCTIYAWVEQDQSDYYHFAIRKHLLNKQYSEAWRTIFGQGDAMLNSLEVSNRLRLMEKALPSNPMWDHNTIMTGEWSRNYSALEAMYSIERSLPLILTGIASIEDYQRDVSDGYSQSGWVNIVPDGSVSTATNLNMARSCCKTLEGNLPAQSTVIAALASIIDPESEYQYAIVPETLRGAYNVPSDAEIYHDFTVKLNIGIGVIATVVAATALTVAFVKLGTFAAGMMGKAWSQYLTLSASKTATANQVGAAYKRYVLWSRIAQVAPLGVAQTGVKVVQAAIDIDEVNESVEIIKTDISDIEHRMLDANEDYKDLKKTYDQLKALCVEILKVISGVLVE